MDNLEKQLMNLPRVKLSRRADIKIKFRLYAFIIAKNCRQFLAHLVVTNMVLRRTLAIAMIVIMIVGGTSFYAYANDSLTEGHALYPLKKAVEAVEKQVAFSQPAKVRTHEKLAERRLQEAALLSQEEVTAEPGREAEQLHERIKKSLDEAVAETGSAVEQVQATGDAKIGQEASARAKDQEARQSQYLDQMTANADARRDKKLLEKIKETKEAMRQYRRELAKDKDRKDKSQPEEEDKPSDKSQESSSDEAPEIRGLKIKPSRDSQPEEKSVQDRRPEQTELEEDD